MLVVQLQLLAPPLLGLLRRLAVHPRLRRHHGRSPAALAASNLPSPCSALLLSTQAQAQVRLLLVLLAPRPLRLPVRQRLLGRNPHRQLLPPPHLLQAMQLNLYHPMLQLRRPSPHHLLLRRPQPLPAQSRRLRAQSRRPAVRRLRRQLNLLLPPPLPMPVPTARHPLRRVPSQRLEPPRAGRCGSQVVELQAQCRLLERPCRSPCSTAARRSLGLS